MITVFNGVVSVQEDSTGLMRYYFSLGEGAAAVIYESAHSGYRLFSVPIYGGEEQWERDFPSFEDCVSAFTSWK